MRVPCSLGIARRGDPGIRRSGLPSRLRSVAWTDSRIQSWDFRARSLSICMNNGAVGEVAKKSSEECLQRFHFPRSARERLWAFSCRVGKQTLSAPSRTSLNSEMAASLPQSTFNRSRKMRLPPPPSSSTELCLSCRQAHTLSDPAGAQYARRLQSVQRRSNRTRQR